MGIPFIPVDGYNWNCTSDQLYPYGLTFLIASQLIFTVFIFAAVKNEDLLGLKDGQLLEYFKKQTYEEVVTVGSEKEVIN